MTASGHNSPEWLQQLPNWLKGGIGLVTIVVSFVLLLQNNLRLGAVVIAGLVIAGLAGFFAYLAFARDATHGTESYRFPRYRRLGLIGFPVVLLLIIGAIAFEPIRSFVVAALSGKAPVVIEVTQGQWRGPWNFCLVSQDKNTLPSEVHSVDFEPWPVERIVGYLDSPSPELIDGLHSGQVIRIQTARSHPLDFYKRFHVPAGLFVPSDDSVFSFELVADQRVRVENIYVQVKHYQPLPQIEDCLEFRPGEEAHLYVAPVEDPALAGTDRFPAFFEAERGHLTSVWLNPSQAEVFYVLIAAENPGLYSLRCCDIEVTQGDEIQLIQANGELTVLFMNAPAEPPPAVETGTGQG